VSNQDNMPGHLARRFQQMAVAMFHTHVDPAGHDLTPVQYSALAAVLAQPGIDQATLAGRIGIDRATITGVIDRLARKGLLTRTVSKADRRARLLQMTDTGTAVLQQIQPAVDAAQDEMVAQLSQEERDLLLALLRKAMGGREAQAAPPGQPAHP